MLDRETALRQSGLWPDDLWTTIIPWMWWHDAEGPGSPPPRPDWQPCPQCECLECEGQGQVEYDGPVPQPAVDDGISRGRGHMYMIYDCPACDGRGCSQEHQERSLEAWQQRLRKLQAANPDKWYITRLSDPLDWSLSADA